VLPDALDADGLAQTFHVHAVTTERSAFDRHQRMCRAFRDASCLCLLPDLAVLQTKERVPGPAGELAVVTDLDLCERGLLAFVEAEFAAVSGWSAAGSAVTGAVWWVSSGLKDQFQSSLLLCASDNAS
jgi:hypothetical protein